MVPAARRRLLTHRLNARADGRTGVLGPPAGLQPGLAIPFRRLSVAAAMFSQAATARAKLPTWERWPNETRWPIWGGGDGAPGRWARRLTHRFAVAWCQRTTGGSVGDYRMLTGGADCTMFPLMGWALGPLGPARSRASKGAKALRRNGLSTGYVPKSARSKMRYPERPSSSLAGSKMIAPSSASCSHRSIVTNKSVLRRLGLIPSVSLPGRACPCYAGPGVLTRPLGQFLRRYRTTGKHQTRQLEKAAYVNIRPTP